MNEKQNDLIGGRRKYEKPKLRIIEMKTEEVLGIGCKLDSGGSAVGDPVTCIGNFCAEVGS